MRSSYLRRALAIVLVLGAATAGAADANGSEGTISVTVSMEAVAITVTGGAIDRGGPHAPGDQVYVSGVSAPQIKNTGNVAIPSMDLFFDGPIGQEALCEGGGTWAGATSPAPDQFALRAAVHPTQTNEAVVDGPGGKFVEPSTGSGEIYASSSDLEPDGTARLVMRLDLPTAVTNGADGCTIDLTLTAYAADD